MLKPINWKTFPRDFAVIQIGFALYGLSIALLIRANLGASPWAVLEVALSELMGFTVGTVSVLVGFVVLASAIALKEQVGWGTLANILCIGPWLDGSLWLLPNITDNLAGQVTYLLAAVVIIGLASAIYIGVDAGAGPRDSLMLAINRTSGVSVRLARGAVEVGVVVVGGLLGGPLGLGTLAFALLVGPAVQWGFKTFNVKTSPSVASEQ